MRLTLELLDRIAGRTVDRPNAQAVITALDTLPAGIGRPHRLAQFLAQVMHESGAFRYDQELWGPTPAQARYDTRTDLGNTPAKDGDGYANRGMGPIQVTGAGNRRAFRDWLTASGIPNAPDFVGNENLLRDPWEGLSAVWYWDAGNPTGTSLNAYADTGNIEAITRKVNGGLNGYADRCTWYARAALIFLGFSATDVTGFQAAAGLVADGIAGRDTRAALHAGLVELGDREEITDPLEALVARMQGLEARVAALEAG